MLQWLKDILGEAYSQELEDSIQQAILRAYIPRQEAQRETDSLSQLLAQEKLERAVDRVLLEARVKNLSLVRKALDLSQLSLDQEGAPQGLDAQLQRLRESDPYLFQSDPVAVGASGSSHMAGPKAFSRQQLERMDPSQINRSWKEVAAALAALSRQNQNLF